MARNLGGCENHRGLDLLVAIALIAMLGPLALCQTSYVSVEATSPIVASPGEPMPAYEVATIKPWNGTGFGLPLRIYIQSAFGIPLNTTAYMIGPDWVSSAKYVIQAKPPDSMLDAMQTMSAEQRRRETGLMEQSLLADRFKLKAHFENREMPVYQLVPAKGGPTLKETTDSIKGNGQLRIGASAIRGNAVPMHELISVLEGVPDIGGRVVIDKTGLTGAYDFSLKWAPMQAAAVPSSGTASTPNAEGPSFFKAVEEQLGLKLVPAKGQGQVLVIDRIEQPTEN
jgi:uncharacterized protein (TIGR03435 family)